MTHQLITIPEGLDVAEHLLAEVAAEDRYGAGLSHPPGVA
jgi:hypothetical protein